MAILDIVRFCNNINILLTTTKSEGQKIECVWVTTPILSSMASNRLYLMVFFTDWFQNFPLHPKDQNVYGMAVHDKFYHLLELRDESDCLS